jgi:hypothetical protein
MGANYGVRFARAAGKFFIALATAAFLVLGIRWANRATPRSGKGTSPVEGKIDQRPQSAGPTEDKPPDDGRLGPHGPVFGSNGNALRIVIVCDACRSVVDKVGGVKNELLKGIESLKPIQTFNIILLQQHGFATLGQGQLLAASPENKRAARRLLDDATFITAADPVAGLTLAIHQHPQVIYLMTDRDFPDNKAVRDAVARLNADHKVTINTTALLRGPEDADSEFRWYLWRIATDNGGTFRMVKVDELVE